MIEFLVILLVIGGIALLAAPWIRGRRGIRGGVLQGTLLVTGVSPRPEGVTGQQFVTVTGVINGPNLNEHVVYQRMAVDVDEWPAMGALFPVVYSVKNPDNWNFAPAEPPPPPAPPAEQPYN